MEHSIVLFDGVCNLCHASVQFILKHDSTGKFHFASLGSTAGITLTSKHPALKDVNSIILIEQDKYYTESTAVLRICRNLDGVWKLFYGLILVPKLLRDAGYRLLAKNRYRLFGKQIECLVPKKEWRDRFIDS